MPARFSTFQSTPLLIGINDVLFDTDNVDPSKDAYLSLCVTPDLTNGPNVRLQGQINGDGVFNELFTSEDQRVWQAIIPPGLLLTNNSLFLNKAGGLGEITVSHCVVHFNT